MRPKLFAIQREPMTSRINGLQTALRFFPGYPFLGVVVKGNKKANCIIGDGLF